MKNYILDDGKVRRCELNISKMNIFEHIYYSWFVWKGFKRTATSYKECLTLIFEGFFPLIAITMFLITFPLSFPICSYIVIQKAKKEVERERGHYYK